MTCEEARQKISLGPYGELAPAAREELETHAAGCKDCSQELERVRRLHALLGESPWPEVAPDALVRCRQNLEAALDREQYGWKRLFADALSFVSRPSHVTTAAALVVFGFGLGWMIRPRAVRFNRPAQPAAEAQQRASLSGLGTIGSISQVSQDPQSDKVRITLNAERRVTLEGSLDNPRIRQILVGAMKGYSNPGIRLDTVNALKRNTGNPSVEDALLYALRNDPNTGVRLEALRAVPGMSWDSQVQSAVVGAIREDRNPGVRVAAIDALVKHALDQRDHALVPVFRNLASSDQNPYVRVKSVAAMHELERGN